MYAHQSILSVLTLCCVVAFAPTAEGQTWSPHLSIGLSSATYVGETDNEFGYRSTMAGGGGVTMNLTPVIGIRAEVLYIIRGAVAENAVIDGEPTELEARFSVAYVDIPVLVVAQLPLASRVSPYVFGGGAYARNVDAQLTLISPSNDKIQQDDSSIGMNELSLVGGAGLSMSVATQKLFVEARFAGGLSNVRPDREDAPFKNRSFLFVAGVRF